MKTKVVWILGRLLGTFVHRQGVCLSVCLDCEVIEALCFSGELVHGIEWQDGCDVLSSEFVIVIVVVVVLLDGGLLDEHGGCVGR